MLDHADSRRVDAQTKLPEDPGTRRGATAEPRGAATAASPASASHARGAATATGAAFPRRQPDSGAPEAAPAGAAASEPDPAGSGRPSHRTASHDPPAACSGATRTGQAGGETTAPGRTRRRGRAAE